VCSVKDIDTSSPNEGPGQDVINKLLGELFSEAEHIHTVYKCPQLQCCKLSNTEIERQKAKSRFSHEWLTDPVAHCGKTGLYWLVYSETQHGMFCILCKKHNTVNKQNKSRIYNIEPACRFRKVALLEHSTSEQHKSAVMAELMQRVSVFDKELKDRETFANEVLYNAFMSCYFLAKEDIANKKLKNFIEFLQVVGLANMKHFRHQSSRSIREIFITTGNVMKKIVTDRVSKAQCFGLLIDEVTDISVSEQLLGFVSYVNPSTAMPQVDYLFIKDVLKNSVSATVSANAETITKLVTESLEECGLPFDNLSSFVSDGCSVMMGVKNGVAARLKRLKKEIISVHCICHRLALACSGANDTVKYIATIETILVQLWSFFNNSPKRTALYVKIQEEVKRVNLTNHSRDSIVRKVRKSCRTRWLSLQNSVEAVYMDILPLLLTLRQCKEQDAIACGLLSKMNSVKFIGAIYTLKKILPHLGALSKTFQRGTVNFARIEPSIQHTLCELDKIVSEGEVVQNLQNDLKKGGRLESCELKVTDFDRDQVSNLLQKYVHALKENIQERFAESNVLASFSVFDPTSVPEADDHGFSEYGADCIDLLGGQFFEKAGQQKVVAEWQNFKFELNSWKKHVPAEVLSLKSNLTPTEWVLKQILSKKQEYKHFYPKLVELAEICMSLPVSNAWPERGASALKRIKSRMRSAMKNDMRDALLTISINGPPVGSNDAELLIRQCVLDWRSQKPRRKLPNQRLVGVPSTSFACPQILLTDDLPVESELSPLTENEAVRQFNVEDISSDSDSDSNCVA